MTASSVNYQKTMWADFSPLAIKCESIALPIYKKVNAYIEKNGLVTNRKDILFFPNCNPFSTECKAVSGVIDGNYSHLVAISPLLLIDLKTIPEKFRVQSLEDERLQDKDFIDDFILWLNQEYFKIEGLNPNDVIAEDRNQLKHFLIMASDPEQFENMVEFVVAHELAHHFFEHRTDLAQPVLTHSLNNRLPWFVGGVLGTLAIGLYALKSTRSKILFGALMGGVGAHLYVSDLSSQLKTSREHEKEADLMAVKAIGKIDGATYWLNGLINIRNHVYSVQLKQKSEAERKQALNIVSNGYWLNDHPSFEERINYIEAFAKDDLSKQLQYWRPVVPFRWTATMEPSS